MQSRQPLSLLDFAIQHGKPLPDAAAKAKMVKFVDKAPKQLGVANVQTHKTLFEPIQPRYLLSRTMLQEIAVNEGAFLGTLFETCHQQPQAGFHFVRDMRSQSHLSNVVILVTNKCVRPRPKKEADPLHAVGELYSTVFAAVDRVGRPLNVRTVERPEDWNQPWACQPPDNKEYWPPVQSPTGRRTVMKGFRCLVGNNRLIVGWENSFHLTSFGIGVSSTLIVNLATDPEVRQCFFQHMDVQLKIDICHSWTIFPGCPSTSRWRWKPFRIEI